MPIKSLRLTALAAALAGSAGAFAADSTTLSVSATVNSVCHIYTTAAGTTLLGTGTLSMTFGGAGIDPATQTGLLQPTREVFYRCNTAVPTLTVGSSTSGTYNGTLTRSAGVTMSYTITWTPPTSGGGFAAATAQSVMLTGNLAQAQYTNALAGTYTDSVGITFTP